MKDKLYALKSELNDLMLTEQMDSERVLNLSRKLDDLIIEYYKRHQSLHLKIEYNVGIS